MKCPLVCVQHHSSLASLNGLEAHLRSTRAWTPGPPVGYTFAHYDCLQNTLISEHTISRAVLHAVCSSFRVCPPLSVSLVCDDFVLSWSYPFSFLLNEPLLIGFALHLSLGVFRLLVCEWIEA